jgi:S-adenosylmethionine:tRNA ribosyltransferase-isomerase
MRTKLGNNPRIRNLFTTFALGIRTNGCFFNRTEEVMKTQEIRIEDYNYSLPDERIAKFPLPKRDESKLLLYRNGEISESIFKHITDYLPQNSLMVFNNTRVIQARLLFQKETGARIEIFCLEPIEPHDYALIFQETRRCSWTCLVGNLKKWKEGTLSKTIFIKDQPVVLTAEKKSHGDTHLIEFTWDNETYTFADILDAAGVLPIPPYLHRETEKSDLQTYQTVYSKIKGSVAAPTAGLHFTSEVLADIDARGIGREEVTLHVGAGTFKPVKSDTIEGHEMHTEFISVRRSSIERIKSNLGNIIAVGTTSVRTLESLYYMGVILDNNPEATSEDLVVKQWMPYDMNNNRLTAERSLQNILDYLDKHDADTLVTATQIIIAPGYEFKIVKGIVTNFHQPKSTLLLLISAFVKGNWKSIYEYALEHDFRFLSYGDSSLLI